MLKPDLFRKAEPAGEGGEARRDPEGIFLCTLFPPRAQLSAVSAVAVISQRTVRTVAGKSPRPPPLFTSQSRLRSRPGTCRRAFANAHQVGIMNGSVAFSDE